MNKQNFSSADNDVFISYRRCNKDLVAPVEDELNRRGISYFIDRDGIDYGMEYSEVISKAIDSCRAMLFFWTPEAKDSRDMLRELKMALDCDKTVIPYKIGKFKAKEHGSLHYFFSTICYYEVNRQSHSTIVEVVDKIQKVLSNFQTDSDESKIERYRQAAIQGDANAQTLLGWCYALGNGVPQDYSEAVKWWKKAADQGHHVAQTLLSLCYTNGNGVPKDLAKANALWSKANEERSNANKERNKDNVKEVPETKQRKGIFSAIGSMFSMFSLFVVGGSIKACTAFPDEAVKSRRVYYELNDCLDTDSGVPQDFTETIKRYQFAAELGDPKAQIFLGFCYANGAGVIKDVAEAKKWYQQAARQGNKEAIKALKELK